ncbi:polysaccharide deacetylase family protein [Desulforamulus aeronauticus]|uniref:Peptidoglycan/xylan/chitin deacetylase, PgdA/CDA1 family n=1 Tax=Desulforamulus aeronauticus DSM 10349 TaxID=1121421 RepID=A0A1M6QUA7_9FIRM|nr:polysaccharide deacetylase family protein [Desulforamulus aeronauticus]SHK23841.1 Peptidoglycan/xylan/chitin deacetylase, PgdA/CDA1 family [Desulforamulus aeronauticus DSM 10349]
MVVLITVFIWFTIVNPSGLKTALGHKAICRVDVTDKVVALTFDDGPDPRYTLPILDTLRQYHAHACFFVVGKNVEAYPNIAKKIISEGHEIGNHTMTHPQMPDLSARETHQEISGCQQIVEKTIGQLPMYYRSPKGLSTDYAKTSASTFGLQEILWTLTIENRNAPTPEKMANRVLEKVQPGYIILLHDGRLNRSKTVQALPLLLKGLQDRGFRVVSLSDLLSMQNTNYDDIS